MQSLQSGMVLIGVGAPVQDVVLGVVLVTAVAIDTIYRRRAARRWDHGQLATPLVEMRDMSVSFGGVHAVKDVTIDLRPGEILGLVGGNGAGKSTLIKTLSGAQRADSGEIYVDGEQVTHHHAPRRQGLRDRDHLSDPGPGRQQDAPSNMFLGRELTDPMGHARRLGDGGRHPEDHGEAQPEVPELQRTGGLSVRWPATVGRHRQGSPFQRPDPDHGRADCGPGPGRDRAGP